MGILSAGATLGEILAPLFLKIGDEKGEVHFYLFGVLSIGAGGVNKMFITGPPPKNSLGCQIPIP